MAISDEKRREVAARLRGVTEEELRSMFLGEILDCAIGGRCLDDEGNIDERLILNRLADLIDRPTCETIEHGQPYESHVCKSCSRCSYGWFEDIHDKPYSYCPNCGAEVVNDD